MELSTLSAIDLAKAIATRKISSVEATERAIDRLKPVHDACNAVVAFETEAALSAARKADAAVAKGGPLGPLHGVPLAHKDMFDRRGRIPSWGGRIHRDEPCTTDATVIQRLEAAGALQIAALHLTEFAFGPTGHNYVLGHAKNPWNRAHITGGSSSGSAISVATGVIPAALGSDTAGSLRLPAAACGIASLKPTWSRVSRAGAMPLSASIDCIGPLARDIRDIALLTSVIAGHDPRDGSSSRRAVPDLVAACGKPVAGMRIGIDETLLRDAHASVQKQVETALAVFEKAGCKRVAVRFSKWKLIDQLTQLVQLPEVASAHGRYIRKRPDDYGPQVRARIEFGHFISGADHQTAVRARGAILAETLAEAYKQADVALIPTFADPLPTIAELDVGGGPSLMAAIARVIHFTRPINYLGLPALTLPYPAFDNAIPNGFQLVGRPFSESRLMSLGGAYQQAVPPRVAKVG